TGDTSTGNDSRLAKLRSAFQKNGTYWLARNEAARPDDGRDGFRSVDPGDKLSEWWQFRPATVVHPAVALRMATDNWPFLYLYEPMIPLRPSLTGAAVMLALALILLFIFKPQEEGKRSSLGFDNRMFFLGAGFMLVETKAVVHMALLFGSTWM